MNFIPDGSTLQFVVRNIKVPIEADTKSVKDCDCTAISLAKGVMRKSGLGQRFKSAEVSYDVHKRSVDARKKYELFYVYSVIATVSGDFHGETTDFSQYEKSGISLVRPDLQHPALSPCPMAFAGQISRPVIAGFGPCGMFCALVLARCGLRPIVLERGEDVDSREKSVNRYWNEGVLDSESNVQFGEGGAGTFSDGKLLTRINDSLCAFVLETFYRHGADADILVNAKPHIGTDKLRSIVRSIRNEIISLGGEVMFSTRLESLLFDSAGQNVHISISGDKSAITTDALFLCLGHSARDTFENLAKCGIDIEAKPFSVGVRVEHLQKNIDKALYGDFAGHPALPKGEYALSDRVCFSDKSPDRAVYTFCMCPGGTVVASASSADTIVTNGMSYYSRDGVNANSAVCVSVDTADLENPRDPFSAIEFQHSIEKKAFELCHGTGAAPIMTMGDFLGGAGDSSDKVEPTYTGKVCNADIRQVFPDFVNDMLAHGFKNFGRKLRGFDDCGAVITAPETRTSSPVKIPRNELRRAAYYPCIFPCGEGAGYAGGITSAAVDGIRSALAYIDSLGCFC